MTWAKRKISVAIVVMTTLLLGFEAYTVAVVNFAGFPPNLGNFERIRNSLKQQDSREKFSFAVVGDTRGSATFERLCDELRDEPLSFVVIAGDFVETCTKSNHDYFRSACSKKYRLACPVFLIAGNHDVVCKSMEYDSSKVLLTDFEKMYGPANFYFEYNGCLFVGLCTLPPPYSTKGSIAFLDSTLAKHRKENQKVFVFTHMPVVRSAGPSTASFEDAQGFIDIIDRYGVDYVISSHFRGYDRTERKDTVYLVTGGGGAPLEEKETFGGLHHAVVLTVDHGAVSEKAVLARHSAGIAGIPRYFAITKLFPVLARHLSFMIAENVMIVGIFLVFSWNIIRSERIPC